MKLKCVVINNTTFSNSEEDCHRTHDHEADCRIKTDQDYSQTLCNTSDYASHPDGALVNIVTGHIAHLVKIQIMLSTLTVETPSSMICQWRKRDVSWFTGTISTPPIPCQLFVTLWQERSYCAQQPRVVFVSIISARMVQR